MLFFVANGAAKVASIIVEQPTTNGWLSLLTNTTESCDHRTTSKQDKS